MANQNLIEKIQALLAKAESTTYEAEADAFYAKAQELMVRYAIDEAELVASGQKRKDEIVIREVSIRDGRQRTKPQRSLLNGIARVMGCRTWYYPKTERNAVCGYESDVEFVIMLWASVNMQLLSSMLREVKAARKAFTPSPWQSKFREGVWLKNYMEGYVGRVYVRISGRYAKAVQDQPESVAIVLRDKGKDVDDWLSGRFQLAEARGRRRSEYDPDAQSVGRVRGNDADISAGRGNVGPGRKELGHG